MKINPIRNKISSAISNFKYERNNRFINKYCPMSNELDSATRAELYPVRSGIAKYAKSKGVKIELLNEVDGDSLQIRVTHAKKSPSSKLIAASEYIPTMKTEDGVGFLNRFYRTVEQNVKMFTEFGKKK